MTKLAITSVALALTLAAPARADDLEDLVRRTMSAPTLRLGFGGAVYTAPEDAGGGFEFDLAAGLRIFVAGKARRLAWLTPEIGYARHGGDEVVEGNYFVLGGSAAFVLGDRVGLALTTGLLLGRTAGEGGVGLRNGLRLEALFGLVGLEIGHEWRSAEASIHGVRVLITTDLFVPVQFLRFLRWLSRL